MSLTPRQRQIYDLIAKSGGKAQLLTLAQVMGVLRASLYPHITAMKAHGYVDQHGETVSLTEVKPPHDMAKMRKCLTCGNDFPSKHIGNRMCPACVERTAGHSYQMI